MRGQNEAINVVDSLQPLEQPITERLFRPLLRFSTAGSVDDGKSTLIGRLLHDTKNLYDDHLESIKKASQKDGKKGMLSFALLTDGLRAEREQGITIDVAYRYFSTPKRNFIMADSPGHEQYTRNMATGASTAECTIVLIDARKGVLTQTRRHAFVASLLGVSAFIVAINKMDLVGFSQDVFNKIRHEFSEFANKLGIHRIFFIPMSALHGDNIVEHGTQMPWYKGDTLLECLENIEVHSADPSAPFRFPVQYVLKDKGDFRGYAGKIASGSVKVGDEVTILPSMRSTVVTAIESYSTAMDQKSQSSAFAPMSVSISLRDQIDIGRGAMIVRAGSLPEVRNNFEAMLVWMHEQPMDLKRPYLLMHTTQDAKVYFDSLQYRIDMHSLERVPATQLGLNDIGRVSLTSPKQLFLDTYRENRATGNFIIIDPETYATVGAGMIVGRHDHGVLPDLSGKDHQQTPVSTNIHREESGAAESLRSALLNYPPVTLWFTGLSGSGKSALAKAMEKLLLEEGRLCYRLDGDNLRFGLNRDLGFSEADRSENIRRVAEVAQLFNAAGVTTLCSFISPYTRDREHAREIVGTDNFIEIYVAAPIEVCEARDPHGLYQKARAGQISEFTGVSSPYEAPRSPELIIDTSYSTVDECARRILEFVRTKAPRKN